MSITVENSSSKTIQEGIKKLVGQYGMKQFQDELSSLGINLKMDEEINVPEDIPGKVAVDFFIESGHFINLSKSTQNTYKSELSMFVNFSNQNYKSSATLKQMSEPKNILAFLEKHKHFSNTRAKKAAFLRTFFRITMRHFFKDKYGNIEDLKEILSIKADVDDTPKALKVNQLREVVHLSTAGNNGLRNFTILMTFLSSGIRLSELVNLQIGDIDVNRQVIKVLAKGKKGNKKPRTINLLGLCILQNYIKFTYQYQKSFYKEENLNELFVFSANMGRTALTQRAIQKIVENLIEQATSIPESEKKQYSTHTFRHCFAVYGLESGIDVFTLAKLLGHESIETTKVYLRLFDDQLKRAIEKHPFANGLPKEDEK